jgi:hypothetical protein
VHGEERLALKLGTLPGAGHEQGQGAATDDGSSHRTLLCRSTCRPSATILQLRIDRRRLQFDDVVYVVREGASADAEAIR